jgi:hypothetical protein
MTTTLALGQLSRNRQRSHCPHYRYWSWEHWRLGRPEAEVDRGTLTQGLRASSSASELARRLGVARSIVRRIVAEGVAKNVFSGGSKS